MNLRPLADRVVILPIEAEETTATGIVIPDTAKEKPQEGQILAAGSGRLANNGERIPMSVKKGDRVLFARYSGTEVKLEGKKMLIMNESEILAVVQQD